MMMPMRTTIEMKPEHRARLLELAARRGHKGFSQLIEEAVDAYLKADAASVETQRRTQALRGSLSSEDAQAMRDTTAAIRRSWR